MICFTLTINIMGRSEKSFSRWEPIQEQSWPFRIWRQYNEELSRMLRSQFFANKYVYSKLKEQGVSMSDYISSCFNITYDTKISLKEWSDTHNLFENWTRLNSLMALSSYFETYISTVISLAIESDPGLLLGTSHSVDGVKLLKLGTFKREQHKLLIDSCTKGDWNQRISNINNLLGTVPQSLIDNIGELEKIRKLRNNIGHAFGRDIAESRKIEKTEVLPMNKLTYDRLMEWLKITKRIANDLDSHLLNNNIGAFQAILFYHNLYPSLDQSVSPSAKGERAKALKKELGSQTKETYGKTICKGIVDYYEGI